MMYQSHCSCSFFLRVETKPYLLSHSLGSAHFPPPQPQLNRISNGLSHHQVSLRTVGYSVWFVEVASLVTLGASHYL